MEKINSIKGKIVDVLNREIFNGIIYISNGKISQIEKVNEEFDNYILPGLIDSHVHIESSMLIPSRFAYFAVKNGVVAVVTDPHEIANVLGIEGIDFMIDDSKKVPLKVYFGAPSCVPATDFETSGAKIDSEAIFKLLQRKDIYFLSEMMNYPGVIYNDGQVLLKLKYAKMFNKPIDGHAPGLRGDNLKKYIQAGVSTDHESYTIEEAEEKIALGMKIQIREGSAAKNFEALYPLIDKYPGMVMLCTDDSHPDDLQKGYINKIVAKAINKGLDLFNVLQAATIVPKQHYGLDVGLLQIGDKADFIVVDNLKDFNVLRTVIDGNIVFDSTEQKVYFSFPSIENPPNKFFKNKVYAEDIKVLYKKESKIAVIKAFDGELITKKLVVNPKVINNEIVSDIDRDILKIVVLNRYKAAKPAVGFINGFGLKKGAIATTVAHDSHNIIAIGVSDKDILDVIERVINLKGGLVVSDGANIYDLPLPVAGLMTYIHPDTVAERYKELNKIAKEKLFVKLNSPFMTLSFMALLVIPELKLSDEGLFDADKFTFVDIFC